MEYPHHWYKNTDTGEYVFNASVLIKAPIVRCFRAWARFEELPQLLRHILRVRPTSPTTQHWTADVGGHHAEWDAEITEFRENEEIAWRAVRGLKNAGVVRFIQANGGCQVAVHLSYDPPYGSLGDLVAERSVNDTFAKDLQEDLHRFKEVMEAAEADRQRRRAA